MFTHYEYLEVVELVIITSKRSDSMSQLLTVKIPRTDTTFTFRICNRIRLPKLKKKDKVRVILDFYSCARSKAPRFTIRDVILLHELNVKEECLSDTP